MNNFHEEFIIPILKAFILLRYISISMIYDCIIFD